MALHYRLSEANVLARRHRSGHLAVLSRRVLRARGEIGRRQQACCSRICRGLFLDRTFPLILYQDESAQVVRELLYLYPDAGPHGALEAGQYLAVGAAVGYSLAAHINARVGELHLVLPEPQRGAHLLLAEFRQVEREHFAFHREQVFA